jgi:nucleoside-diphosphate kinase
MEKSLIIFKPDCMEKQLVGTVLNRFERAGFRIIACKMLSLTPELLRQHYSHIADRPFYPALEKFMGSRPVIAMALEGENAIAKVREMLGATDSRKADKGTIRNDFGVDNQINILHASDSPENGLIEIKRFFRDEEVFA